MAIKIRELMIGKNVLYSPKFTVSFCFMKNFVCTHGFKNISIFVFVLKYINRNKVLHFSNLDHAEL